MFDFDEVGLKTEFGSFTENRFTLTITLGNIWEISTYENIHIHK